MLSPAWLNRRADKVRTADVIVYRDGDYAVAVDGRTGTVIARNTDHAYVIQEAINYLPSNRTSISTIELKGVFEVDKTITLPSYTRITGGKIIKNFDGTLIINNDTVNGNSYIELDGVEINSNSHYGFNIRLVGCNNVKITSCKIYNSNQQSPENDIAISVAGISSSIYSNYILIANNYISGFSYKGISLGNYVNDAWIINNTVTNTEYINTSYPSDSIYIYNNYGNRVYIAGNKCISNKFRALFIYGNNIKIMFNDLVESGDYLLWVEYGEFITIFGNYLYGGGILAGTGQSLNVKQGRHIVIEANKIYSSYGHGLELGHHISDVSGDAYIDDVIIHNNIIINPNEANTTYYGGIYITTENKSDAYISNVEIIGNIIRDIRSTPQMVVGIWLPSQTGGYRDNILIMHNIISGATSGDTKILSPSSLKYNSGTATFSGDGTTTQFKIAHGLVKAPSRYVVTPASADAAGSFYVTADDTYLYVNYSTAPAAGTNNVVLNWWAEV